MSLWYTGYFIFKKQKAQEEVLTFPPSGLREFRQRTCSQNRTVQRHLHRTWPGVPGQTRVLAVSTVSAGPSERVFTKHVPCSPFEAQTTNPAPGDTPVSSLLKVRAALQICGILGAETVGSMGQCPGIMRD